jgi:hypothetical protein
MEPEDLMPCLQQTAKSETLSSISKNAKFSVMRGCWTQPIPEVGCPQLAIKYTASTLHIWRLPLPSERTSSSSGQQTCFVLERLRVHISSREQIILTEVSRGFPQSFQANIRIVL